MSPTVYSREEAAKVLGVSYQRVCQLEKGGRLTPVPHHGKGVLYSVEQVQALLEKRKGQGGATRDFADGFKMLEAGKSIVDMVIALQIHPDRAHTIAVAYAKAANCAIVSASELALIRKEGFGATSENLGHIMHNLLNELRMYRAQTPADEIIEAYLDRKRQRAH